MFWKLSDTKKAQACHCLLFWEQLEHYKLWKCNVFTASFNKYTRLQYDCSNSKINGQKAWNIFLHQFVFATTVCNQEPQKQKNIYYVSVCNYFCLTVADAHIFISDLYLKYCWIKKNLYYNTISILFLAKIKIRASHIKMQLIISF